MSAPFRRLSHAERLPPSDGAEVYRLLPSMGVEAAGDLAMTDLDARRPDDRGPVSEPAGQRTGLAHEQSVRLGALFIDPPSRRVAHDDGREEFLEPRVMQVLVTLLRAEGRILSRDELLDTCWPGVMVGEDALNRVMGRLRRLAGGVGEGAFRIETVTKVGYRLVAAGAERSSAATSAPATTAPQLPLGVATSASICVLP